MKNKIILILTAVIILSGFAFFLLTQKERGEEQILSSTYDVSKEYLLLRVRTDEILVNAEEYTDYSSWDSDMTAVIQDWNKFYEKVSELEESANIEFEKSALNTNLIQTAHAYTSKEITDIYDKAPRFKGIATLAKHLGVDAQRAQLILNQAQDETTAEGWTEAGDTLQKLETSAVVIKDGCKVAGFVGGVVLTGGAAGLATAGTLTQVTTVVVGVDLALEVTEDGAQIALGDKNKISSFVKDVRVVTEPIANVMTITNIPSNLGNAFGKFDSVMIGLEQFRESAQEGKVIGIDLTNFEYHPSFQVIKKTEYPGTVSIAEMEKAEVEEWLESLNKNYQPMSKEEVKEFLKSTDIKSETKKDSAEQIKEEGKESSGKTTTKSDGNNLANTAWKGTLHSDPISGGKINTVDFDFVLKEDGKIEGEGYKKWTQEGDRIKVFVESGPNDYYEFKVDGQELLLTKLNIKGEFVQPGEKFAGGLAPWGFIYPREGSVESGSKNAMPIGEFNEMSDDGQFKNIAQVTERLGEPNVKTTDDNGKIIYIYYDLVKYNNGNLGSVKMAFYNEEGYRSYIENMGGSWESNKENWEESGGGIRASEEIKPKDTLKSIYGE